MGYCTRYEILIPDLGGEDGTAIYYDTIYDQKVSDFMDGNTEPYKWYNHEEDMKALSLKYPTALFQLKGDGEDAGDNWLKYFKNGRMQVCRGHIEYAPFDPEGFK